MLELERTSVPLTNKEVSKNCFLGKFNFRNFKFEVLSGYPDLTLLLDLLLQGITGSSIPLPECPAVNQIAYLTFLCGFHTLPTRVL